MDALALLSLQIEWGADEALENEPVARLGVRPAMAAPNPARAPANAAPGVPPARPVPPPAAGPVAVARDAADRAADLDALRAAIAAFDGCGLRDTATRPAVAPAARLVIVGEVPDEEEDRSGTPFAGRPGQLLDRMLASIGLDRAGLLLLPLIPWRPPGNRPPSPLELSICLPFLERALHLAGPSHLLLMGSRPARLVAGTQIRAGGGWRVPVLPGLPPGCRALAMRHPSYLLSHLPARREAWADLLRLRHRLDAAANAGPGITEP